MKCRNKTITPGIYKHIKGDFYITEVITAVLINTDEHLVICMNTRCGTKLAIPLSIFENEYTLVNHISVENLNSVKAS
jgi:hypothetical protein